MNRTERSLLSFLAAPVVVGDPDGRAVYVNPAFEGRFGVAAEAAAGLPLAELFQGGSREAVLGAVAEVCGRGESVRFRVRERGAAFAAVASPIVADEARVGVLILLEEELEDVERLLAIQREIADPIDELEAALQALLEQTGGRRSARHRIEVEDGLRSLARLRKWSEELRTALAGQTGAREAAADFDPGEVVREVARRLSARGAAPLELLAPGSLPRARGDGPKIEAMLLRLVSDSLAREPRPEALTLAARAVGRASARSVLLSFTERFAEGAAFVEAHPAPLVCEVVAAAGGALHVLAEPSLGRATLLSFPFAGA